ncbi:MAG: VOC family protein [Synechococcales cyanobacterium]
MLLHHVSIKTADIFRAIAFYERLGFHIEKRFTAGITLACWLLGSQGRIELMQVPTPNLTHRPDPFGDPDYVGYYHLSLLVDNLEATLAALADIPVEVLLPPTRQTIEDLNYRVAFIRDPDGLPIELMQITQRDPVPHGIGDP